MKKPIKRSEIRLLSGKIYYTIKKYLYWYFSKVKFATKFTSPLPVEIFCHKTILRRKLKKIDMWLQ